MSSKSKEKENHTVLRPKNLINQDSFKPSYLVADQQNLSSMKNPNLLNIKPVSKTSGSSSSQSQSRQDNNNSNKKKSWSLANFDIGKI